jgi:hypothetical protein
MLQALAPLRPLDTVVVLAIHDLAGAAWTYATLAGRLGISDSQAHAAVQRAVGAHLFDATNRSIRTRSLLEFLEHGIRYAFPVEPGPFTRGIPTGASAPPLDALLRRDSTSELVWPDVDGTLMGQSVSPLHSGVPAVARTYPSLHQLLALIDSLRLGGARERELAVKELRNRLEPS